MTNEPEHTMIFEVRGDPLTAFREIMAKTDLDDNDLEFMRIEVGASKPIIAVGKSDEPVPESPDESEQKPYKCACGERFSTVTGRVEHESNCPEYQDLIGNGDRPDEGGETESETKSLPEEKEMRLLRGDADMAEIAEEYADDPDPEKWKAAFESVSLSPDTHKWNVAGVLYRKQGRLQTGDIREVLEGTDLEMDSSTISQSLNDLMSIGVVDRVEGTGWPKYQLTQFGRDLMEYKVRTSGGYQLTAVDKAVGVHPTG